jgi:thermostable 8-oxoguanine DNA glycosylase
VVVELVERPLPKPSSEGYVEARLLEALGEARLALEYLERGLTRNATCKAFQDWKALLAVLLKLELDKLKALAKTEEERRRLESKAVPRVPTAKMKELSRLLRDVGHEGITFVTALALDLHDYQYHGPDPDMALSKYATRESAAADVVELLQELLRRVEVLKGRVSWTEDLEKSLEEVKRGLGALDVATTSKGEPKRTNI